MTSYKYVVIKMFADLQDNNYVYSVGDIYPRNGHAVLKSRIKELSTSENRRGEPLIEKVKEEH